MSVVNGQLANQTTFNNAFMSRTAATTSTIAAIALNNGGSAVIADTQKYIQQLADTSGETENDATRKTYSSTGFVANGDSQKTAIGKLDAGVTNHETRIDNLEALNSSDVTLAAFGSTPSSAGASLLGQQLTMQPADASNPGGVSTTTQSFAGNKTFTGNLTVTGDFVVNGTTTTLNTSTVESEDNNILLNKGGVDAGAEEGGVDVQRTTTNGGFRFDSTLASKWKAGLIGSLSEVVTVGVLQTITGRKIHTGQVDWQGVTAGDVVTDAATTGSNAALPAPAKRILRLTNGSLSSISTITGGVTSQEFILVNVTGNTITVNDTDTGTNDIRTGTGGPISVTNQASLFVCKDPTSDRWRIVGGSASSGGSSSSPPGAVVDYAGSTEPTGWLFCYGQAISRATFSDLFAAIGTTFGVGDGSTTFNLPDLRGRVGAGRDNMGGSAANRITNAVSGFVGTTLGAGGGLESHTLTSGEMPSHTHTQDAHTHTQNAHTHVQDSHMHSVVLWGAAVTATPDLYCGTTTEANSGVPDPVYNGPTVATNQNTTATNQNTGGGGAHRNVQPTMILNKIIKT